MDIKIKIKQAMQANKWGEATDLLKSCSSLESWNLMCAISQDAEMQEMIEKFVAASSH